MAKICDVTAKTCDEIIASARKNDVSSRVSVILEVICYGLIDRKNGGKRKMSDIIEFIILSLISIGSCSLESPSKNGCYQEDVRELKEQILKREYGSVPENQYSR